MAPHELWRWMSGTQATDQLWLRRRLDHRRRLHSWRRGDHHDLCCVPAAVCTTHRCFASATSASPRAPPLPSKLSCLLQYENRLHGCEISFPKKTCLIMAVHELLRQAHELSSVPSLRRQAQELSSVPSLRRQAQELSSVQPLHASQTRLPIQA